MEHEISKPYLSVIICTYNRDKYIYNVLKSIAENTLATEKYEIVLVNNNSTDSTETECNKFSKDYENVVFRYFVETNQGLSYARNRGIQEAKGEVVVYVDDDATINKEYLQTYYDFFEKDNKVEAAGGPILPVYETVEPKWMSHYTRQLITGKLYMGNVVKEFTKGAFPGGGNAAYRRSVFDKVGLFNVDLGRKGTSLIGAEEKDLFDKMVDRGIQIYYLPNAILYHIIPDSKLTEEHFKNLTYSIGKSERIRTLTISKKKYYSRLFSEVVKWGGSIILWIRFFFTLDPSKGNKLIWFRYNVTKGLLGL
jgi:glycosyltransferase involved in cell wall biosynthesis